MATTKSTIAIAVTGDVGNEAQAIRSTLEYFGYRVIYIQIGRPKDFIEVINGKILYNDISILIISCHGDNGKILMPVLSNEVYEVDEPTVDFDDKMIETYGLLNGRTVILTGCTLGRLSESFKKVGSNYVIATDEYIDGNASLIFVLHLFYSLAGGADIKKAFELASSINNETKLFKLQ